jgi:hypothetical protein
MDTMDTRIETAHHATVAMRQALQEHGLPTALCHIPIRVRKLIPDNVLRDLLNEARRTQPAATPTTDTAEQTLIAYCDNHPYVIITTRALADVAGCSQHTVRKFITNHPQYFKRFNQYKWEIRNYKEERQHDKETSK